MSIDLIQAHRALEKQLANLVNLYWFEQARESTCLCPRQAQAIPPAEGLRGCGGLRLTACLSNAC